MVIINDRVKSILDLIGKFGCADVTQIARLYFPVSEYSVKNAQMKLTQMCNDKLVKRKRNNINAKYYYWLYDAKEPMQVQHRLLLVELYIRLCERFGQANVECEPEYTKLSYIRPDAFLTIRSKHTYIFFAEIHISNNPFDFDKYNKAFLANKTERIFPDGVFPTILAISDKPLKNEFRQLNFKQVGTNFEGLEKVIPCTV